MHLRIFRETGSSSGDRLNARGASGACGKFAWRGRGSSTRGHRSANIGSNRGGIILRPANYRDRTSAIFLSIRGSSTGCRTRRTQRPIPDRCRKPDPCSADDHGSCTGDPWRGRFGHFTGSRTPIVRRSSRSQTLNPNSERQTQRIAARRRDLGGNRTLAQRRSASTVGLPRLKWLKI